MVWKSPSKAERLDKIFAHARQLFRYLAKVAWWNNIDDIRNAAGSVGDLHRMMQQLVCAEDRCTRGHIIIPGGRTCTQCGAVDE